MYWDLYNNRSLLLFFNMRLHLCVNFQKHRCLKGHNFHLKSLICCILMIPQSTNKPKKLLYSHNTNLPHNLKLLFLRLKTWGCCTHMAPHVLYDSALISILFLITAYSAAGAQCNQPIQRDSKQDTSHVVKSSDLIWQTYCLKFLQTCDCLRVDDRVYRLCFLVFPPNREALRM